MEWVWVLLGLSIGLNLGAWFATKHRNWLLKRHNRLGEWEKECQEHHLPGDCPLCGAK